MSIAKEIIEDSEYYRKIAFEEMKIIGAIKTCDIHPDYWYITVYGISNNVYAVVTNRVKEKYGNDNNYELLHKQIKNILDEAVGGPDNCPFCSKLYIE